MNVETLIKKLHSGDIKAYQLFPQPFMPGDIVIVGPEDHEGSEETIVAAGLDEEGGITYSTDDSSWHYAEDMKLVRKGTAQ